MTTKKEQSRIEKSRAQIALSIYRGQTKNIPSKNKRMVELDAVLRILGKTPVHMYNCTEYAGVPKSGYGIDKFKVLEKIQALPSIPNPIEIVESMKEELTGLQPPEWALAKKDILDDFLSKLKS